MPSCTTCNVCDEPQSSEDAADVARVPCQLRQFNAHYFTVWRCSHCLSLHSKEDVDLATYYRDYPGHKVKLDPAIEIGFRNRLRMLKQRGLRRDAKILDFGCGSGLFVDYLRRSGYGRAVGYDEYVPRFANPQVLDATYDAVVSYDVIEHMEAPRACLEKLSSIVAPGGLLVIGTPNAEQVTLRRRPFELELHQPFHRHILSERALVELAGKLGLAAEHIHRRLYIDSLYPALNSRFIWAYMDEFGGALDPLFEPVRFSVLARTPRLWFYMFFGYFFRSDRNILISFRRAAA